MQPYNNQLMAAAAPSYCAYCKRFIPETNSCRQELNNIYCPDHVNNSCSSTASEAYTFGNFRLTYDETQVQISFDPNAILAYNELSALIMRTPLVLLGLKRCFQLEIFKLPQNSADTTPKEVQINQENERVNLTFQFAEPAVQQVTADDQQAQPELFDYQKSQKLSQLQINPKFVISNQMHFQYQSLDIHIICSLPPAQCKQLYGQYAVNYVLRADLAQPLLNLYPACDYITEEFAFLMFKPLMHQVARIVSFDKSSKSIFTPVSAQHKHKSEQANFFKLENNDSFELENAHLLNEQHVLVYVHALCDSACIASSKRKERQTAAFARNYICMNQFMSRFSYAQLALKDESLPDIQLLVPSQIVPAKLVLELYSRFVPIQQTVSMTWDYESNFQNTYVRFLDENMNVMEKIIEQMSTENKDASLRVNREKTNAKPNYVQAALILDLGQFYQSIPKPAKGDEDKKLAGTSGHVILEPMWQNTFVQARVSFPNYQFNTQTCADLRRGGVVKGENTQLGSGQILLDHRNLLTDKIGTFFEFACLDELLSNTATITLDSVLSENIFSDTSIEQISDLTLPPLQIETVRPKYLQINTSNFDLNEYQTKIFLDDFVFDFNKVKLLCQKNAQVHILGNVFSQASYLKEEQKEELEVRNVVFETKEESESIKEEEVKSETGENEGEDVFEDENQETDSEYEGDDTEDEAEEYDDE
ncbi:Conserved_hypothetical protein [Hexamita inflata]|uniref:Uncharacterized protein n=1 Tax=Hexamita inflata TaxID=28002 RepID=A0AA86TQB0_9EUKA|nr:Conserved hypothetical protein [Hexamita inflata]